MALCASISRSDTEQALPPNLDLALGDTLGTQGRHASDNFAFTRGFVSIFAHSQLAHDYVTTRCPPNVTQQVFNSWNVFWPAPGPRSSQWPLPYTLLVTRKRMLLQTCSDTQLSTWAYLWVSLMRHLHLTLQSASRCFWLVIINLGS